MSAERRGEPGIGDAYDARAADYVELFGDIEQSAILDRDLVARWRDGAPGRLLDAGCGPGHWTAFLHDGHRDVIGIDLSEQFVAAARARHPDLSFARGSFFDLPVADASLGGILAWYSIIHTQPRDVPTAMNSFARAIRRGGSLLVGFFDGEPGRSFAHAVAPAYHWSAEALEALLGRAGFTVTETQRRHDDGHRPHGALVARRDG